ncbi:MAG: PPK2 family polyphosphate kinase [Acidimicrobiia bacterium]
MSDKAGATTSVRALLAADRATDPLGVRPADARPGISDREAAEKAGEADREALAEWQERLHAGGRRSLLVVLQGLDTSGKGGVVEHVIGAVNPQGCRITGFKRPTDDEASHHYLWRIRRALPAPGQVGIFDRSHYEDVLVPRVHGSIGEPECATRYGEIVEFEAGLAAAGTTVVKCFLHISYDEQRRRLLARLADASKRWKFREGDIDERAHWHAYQDAYRLAVRSTHTPAAPWYVVPADRKWYRNWAIGRILVETFEEMSPEYPSPDLDLGRLRKRLAPPN